jgi:hypothetical protein
MSLILAHVSAFLFADMHYQSFFFGKQFTTVFTFIV